MEELKPAIWFPEYMKYESSNVIENDYVDIDFSQIKVSYVNFEGIIDELSFKILLEFASPAKLILLGS